MARTNQKRPWRTALTIALGIISALVLLGWNAGGAAAQTGPVDRVPMPAAVADLNFRISHVACVDNTQIEVHFILNQLPAEDGISSYGIVDYVVNGAARQASFQQRTGDAAHYADYLAAADGSYAISAGSVTLTTTAGQQTATLANPGTFKIAGCGATPVPPTTTAVPPTATPVPPTATRPPPTATPVPPTATRPPAPTQTCQPPPSTPRPTRTAPPPPPQQTPTPRVTCTVPPPPPQATGTPRPPRPRGSDR